MRRQQALPLASLLATLLLAACNNPGTAPQAGQTPPAATPAAAKNTAPDAGNAKIAATVNGVTITERRIDELVKHFNSQNPGQGNTPEARKMILDQLVMQTLIAQDATQKGLDKKPEIAEQLELTRQSVLASALIQDYIATHPVSDEAVEAEYNKTKAEIASTEYKARHILVEKEDLAKSLIAKLKANPGSFAALAKANSKDPGSKDKGGDLGWFDPRAMVPEFGNAVAHLQKGKITDEPVHSKFGYHIIALDDTRQQAVPPLDQIKPMIRQKLHQQMVKHMLDELKSKAKIDIAAAPATPAATTPATPQATPAAGDAKPAEKK